MEAEFRASCKKESVLSTILEVVEEQESEVIPTGLTTVNISELVLSFYNSDMSSDEPHFLKKMIPYPLWN